MGIDDPPIIPYPEEEIQVGKYTIGISPIDVDWDLDPNMTLLCLWCGKDYKPYDQFILNEMEGFGFAWQNFCSDRCVRRYNSILGSIWRGLGEIKRRIRRFIMDPIEKLLYVEECPYCGEDLFVMTKNYLFCANLDCEMWSANFERHVSKVDGKKQVTLVLK